MLTFFVPPGIGDFSAMYQKLCTQGRDITIRSAMDSPNRLGPFLDILPGIINGGYASHSATASLMQTLPPGTDISKLPDGEYFLSINAWLEEGNRVEDWIPGPTKFHYNMKIPTRDLVDARNALVGTATRPRVGIYTSAYGNSRHWGFWDAALWIEFMKLIAEALPPETHYIFIGAEYDLAISEVVYAKMLAEGHNGSHLVGQMEIGGTIEIIRSLDYFFSFPSGLGFLADVVNTPNTMWFPTSLDKMRYTFLDPANIDTGLSLHKLFDTPDNAAHYFRTGMGLNWFKNRFEGRRLCEL